MKIYTKTGDQGMTSLYGGTRVSKNNIRIEAYGTVDELNATIGLIRDHQIDKTTKNNLLTIQNDLFTLGAMLATPKEKEVLKSGKQRLDIPKITEASILFLEKNIDIINTSLPQMKHFILPGGHIIVSHCHIARCVCRRSERICVALSDLEEIDVQIIKYLNRLSDYLFVLARKLTYDNQCKEIQWIPNHNK